MKYRKNLKPAHWLAIAVVTLPPAAQADKPLWELGVGAVAFRQAHYLGADQARNLILPFPYLIYRGEKIRADNGRVRGLLLNSERLDVDISLGGSLPVSSSDNRLRDGMPDLDPVLEVGPSLKYSFFDNPAAGRLLLELPLRWSHSVDSRRIQEHGWLSAPQFTFTRRADYGQWRFSLGAVYGSRQFQGYFYDVEPEYVSASRPAYTARQGLMAYHSTLGFEKRIDNMMLGVHLAYYDLSDAENLTSPLLADEGNLSIGLRVAWILRKSKRMVKTRD